MVISSSSAPGYFTVTSVVNFIPNQFDNFSVGVPYNLPFESKDIPAGKSSTINVNNVSSKTSY